MKREVEVLSTKTLFSDIFRVEEIRHRHQRYDGAMSPPRRGLVFERGDAVTALIRHSERDTYVLVEQFRLPTLGKGPGWLLELMAGKLETGETPEQALRREVVEETGFEPLTVTPLSCFYPSPGACSERLHLFHVEVRGQGLTYAGVEDEDLAVREFTRSQLETMLAAGEFQDGKTILGVQWLLLQARA
ncbi:MAG: hypothetical protein A2284_06775 [Deltaproteobacteria bacterium RIFOXYA12_FULL_61_11]|nr:MAG: hypothetical protein A2284_06775 [Deltaproteobacteria bacterium RIFOXYA12_FULL_61_11]